jgi:hypothetical protein
MNNIFSFLNTIQIPDFWLLVLTFLLSVSIVYLIEYLKRPSVKIDLFPDLILPDGKRKFLKIKIKVYKSGWLREIFPWQNPASFARLKCYLIESLGGKELEVFSYTAKWDTRPEPWDYEKNIPRIELLPATSEPENFVVGDEGTTAVAAKHKGEDNFYIYDGNYYVNQIGNKRDEKKIKLRVIFSSSSVTTRKDFAIVNGNSTLEAFSLKEILK